MCQGLPYVLLNGSPGSQGLHGCRSAPGALPCGIGCPAAGTADVAGGMHPLQGAVAWHGCVSASLLDPRPSSWLPLALCSVKVFEGGPTLSSAGPRQQGARRTLGGSVLSQEARFAQAPAEPFTMTTENEQNFMFYKVLFIYP